MQPKCPLHALFNGSSTPAKTQSPLSSDLKTLTQTQHDETEGHGLHAVLFGARGVDAARDAYVRMLGQHLRIQEAFEPKLRRAATSSAFAPVVQPHHFHLASLRDDIDALKLQQSLSIAQPSTSRFIEFIESCGAGDAHRLLGVFYVFEGSTNGGTIIGKKVKELLGLPDDRGTKFINPHGSLVRPRWTEWKTAVDAIAFSPDERTQIIEAAKQTFRFSGEVLNDVHAAMSLDPGVHAARPTAHAHPR